MKYLLSLVPFLLSSLAFAGGGSCSDCFMAYYCKDVTGEITVEIDGSGGLEFDGAMGSIKISAAAAGGKSEYHAINFDPAVQKGMTIDFEVENKEMKYARELGFRLDLPTKGTKGHEKQTARAFLLRDGNQVAITCEGGGFFEE